MKTWSNTAPKKRARKGIPLLIANHAQSTFGADDNQVTLIDGRVRRAPQRLPMMAKVDWHVWCSRRSATGCGLKLGPGSQSTVSEVPALRRRGRVSLWESNQQQQR